MKSTVSIAAQALHDRVAAWPPLRNPRALAKALTLAVASTLATPGTGSAQADVPFKFTTGLYHVRAGGGLEAGPGLDVNVRYTRDAANVWVGWFRSPVLGFAQWRAGWDDRLAAGPVTLVPSLQVASGGFVGGSAAVEAGAAWFGAVGIGRTNRHTYANLNFDPNDAWFVYGGHRYGDQRSIQLQWIRDNRDNPDQQHVHLLWRHLLATGDRLTIDLLWKRGTVQARAISRGGLAIGYDWPRWFVKVAWDPLVNFTPQDMLRLSVGSRF